MSAKKSSLPAGFRHDLLLVPGPWATRLPDQRRMLLLAEALNLTTEELDCRVKGYLITPQALYLLLRTLLPDVEVALEVFYGHVRELVRAFLEGEQSLLRPHPFGPPMREGDWEPLFGRQALRDRELVALLLGKQVDLPFEDPRLKRLRGILRGSFSSVGGGAMGPVVMGK